MLVKTVSNEFARASFANRMAKMVASDDRR
jgi:hypothetical protein